MLGYVVLSEQLVAFIAGGETGGALLQHSRRNGCVGRSVRYSAVLLVTQRP